MEKYSSIADLVESLTTGEYGDMNLLLITTGVVEDGMTTKEAIDEQLDIVFDEVLKFNPSLFSNRQHLEKHLRSVGEYWFDKLEKK